MKEPYFIKKNGLYYADNHAGYTQRPELAGIYTKEEADEVCNHPRSECVAVKAADVISYDWAEHCINKLTIIRDAQQQHNPKLNGLRGSVASSNHGLSFCYISEVL